MQLNGKTALITGASRGIGAAIAKRFAAEGASVAVNYHSSPQKAEAVVVQIVEAGGQAIAVRGNLRETATIDDMVARVGEAFGRIDILVNNAGWASLQSLEEITRSDLVAQFELNVFGLIETIRAAAPYMSEGGRIINITSIAAKGGAGGAVYGATKAAGNSLTKSFAEELGPRGITVNAVAPAAVETDLDFEVGLDQRRDAAIAGTPLGRAGSVDDVASAALYFASDDAAWVTGEILQVSGGRAM